MDFSMRLFYTICEREYSDLIMTPKLSLLALYHTLQVTQVIRKLKTHADF
jgi:hypothetical protein